jgi:hypothetical protein
MTRPPYPEMVILECPQCGGIGTSKQNPTDPDGTAKVRMLCPECAKGDFSLVSYFDANGKQLLPRLSRCV